MRKLRLLLPTTLKRRRLFVTLNQQVNCINAERGSQRYKRINHHVGPPALNCADLRAMQTSTVRKFLLGHASVAAK